MTTELRDISPPPVPPPATGAEPHRWRHLLGILGPGLVTGAADDDPSGMALVLLALALLAVLRISLAVLSRRRLAAWETAWSRVGPQWTAGRS